MNTALTLICNPEAPALTATLLRDVETWLATFATGQINRTALADGIAEELIFDTVQDQSLPLTVLKDILGDAPIDIAIMPTEHRRKKLLIADMDSTIIEQECIDELAEFAGKRDEISAITERAMRGELDFDGALKERVAMLKGLPEQTLEKAFTQAISLTPGAKELVATMNNAGALTALVSGGFTFFTSRVAARVGFKKQQANELIIDRGKLTGEVREPILGRAAKEQTLQALADEHTILLSQTLAVGDGANDLAMLGRAGSGVAFHAKPAVAAAADIQINHGDLTALLYLQGIARKDFINA